MHILYFVYSSVDRHLGCSYLLAVVNNATLYMVEQISLWDPPFNSLGYIFRNRIAGPHGSIIFNFLRIFHTVFHSGRTIAQSWQQYTRVPILPHPHQPFLFFFIAFLMGVRWYIIVVLIYISLMISDVEHLFTCLLATCIHLWRNVYSSLLSIFWLGYLGFFCLF